MSIKVILLIALVPAFMVFGCSEQNGINDNCDVIINVDGPGFLKVINNLNGRAEIFLPEYAFAALLDGNTCEIYGLNTDSRKAEISICTDHDCDAYTVTKKITFIIEDSKTHIIELTADYFN